MFDGRKILKQGDVCIYILKCDEHERQCWSPEHNDFKNILTEIAGKGPVTDSWQEPWRLHTV